MVTACGRRGQTADRMFISMHTVAFHLRQVFRKLEIGSRVDLAWLVLERRTLFEAPPRTRAAKDYSP